MASSQSLVPTTRGKVQIIQTSGDRFIPPNAFYNPPPKTIRGINSAATSWWTGGQPIAPIAPPDTSPRGWQFLSEQNKIFTPRATERLTFDDLRELASYPLAATLIAIHADIVASRKWKIRLRQLPGMTSKKLEQAEKKDDNIRRLTDFLMNPNPDSTWRELVWMWIHEVQSIDAPAVYFRRDRRRNIAEIRVIDGAMIARYIDDNGWTPSSESPAYAQLWWGIPAWDLSRDQLFYRPKYPRAYKLYGQSPTERMARYIQLGFLRLDLRLQWGENGTIPDGLMVVPRDTSIEMIERQQAWLTANNKGMGKRVQLRMIQGFTADGKDQIIFPKEKMLTDQYDEFEIRMLCGAYGVSKQRFMQMMTRSTAEVAQEAAEEEGTAPTEQYVLDSVNIWIQSPLYFNLPQYEFTYEDYREKDPEAQSSADINYLKNGIKTLDEVRDSLGLDAIEASSLAKTLADQPVIITAQGVIPFLAGPLPKEPASKEGEGEGEPTGEGAEAGPLPVGTPKGKRITRAQRAAESRRQVEAFIAAAHEDGRFEKATPGMSINPQHYSLNGERARHGMELKVKKYLEKVSKKFVAKVNGVTKVAKADLRKSDENEIKKLLNDEFWTTLWVDLPEEVQASLEEAVRAGMSKAMIETDLNITDKDTINAFNAIAQDYASKRAAELVGMKYVDGELVANPKAQYVISDTTRNELRHIITKAFEDNTPMDDLIAEIEDAGSFNPVRAQMIAKTEVGTAQAGGTYEVWKQSGIVKTVRWQTSNLPNVCEDCQANADAGEIEFGKAFPSGDLYPTIHPHCRCVVYAVKTGKA